MTCAKDQWRSERNLSAALELPVRAAEIDGHRSLAENFSQVVQRAYQCLQRLKPLQALVEYSTARLPERDNVG